MFFRSLFWERTALSLVEKVQRLPPNVQAEFSTRVGSYIDIASTARAEDSLERFVKIAVMLLHGCDPESAKQLLDAADDRLGAALARVANAQVNKTLD